MFYNQFDVVCTVKEPAVWHSIQDKILCWFWYHRDSVQKDTGHGPTSWEWKHSVHSLTDFGEELADEMIKEHFLSYQPLPPLVENNVEDASYYPILIAPSPASVQKDKGCANWQI